MRKFFINDGSIEMMIPTGTEIPLGFKKGRIGRNVRKAQEKFVENSIERKKKLFSLPFDEMLTMVGKTEGSLIKERLLVECGGCCTRCGISEWQSMPIVLEVDHIDGDNTNWVSKNLRILCPNCHSQTDTFRNYSRETNPYAKKISDELFVEKLKSNKTVRRALVDLGLSPKGNNYKRAYDLIMRFEIEHLKKKDGVQTLR